MSGHTPGPWHVVDGGPHWNNPAITNYRLHAASGTHGYDVAWSPDGELVAEHVYEKADALLIAAAPELLAELQKCRDYLSTIPESAAGGDDEAVSLARKANAAIAKATGTDEPIPGSDDLESEE